MLRTCSTPFSAGGAGPGDVFILDWGVVVFWNLMANQENDILKLISPYKVKPMPESEVQIEELSFHYSAHEPPHVQNDVITIQR